MSGPAAARARFWSAGLPLVAATALLSAVSWPPVGEQPRGRTRVVEIRSFEYRPAALEVTVGDTLVWVNRDMVPHTATAAGWDSGAIPAGGMWSLAASSPGAVAYHCTYHPAMRAKLVIRERAASAWRR